MVRRYLLNPDPDVVPWGRLDQSLANGHLHALRNRVRPDPSIRPGGHGWSRDRSSCSWRRSRSSPPKGARPRSAQHAGSGTSTRISATWNGAPSSNGRLASNLSSPSKGVALDVPLGVYAGDANPFGVATFGSNTGTIPSFATDYLDKTGGWAAMDGAPPTSRPGADPVSPDDRGSDPPGSGHLGPRSHRGLQPVLHHPGTRTS